ncbi:hypothetical protein Tco_0123410 [Tanacetum coccineum]
MPYLRFTKVIIDHFISKDNSISMRNKINLHTAHDDSLLGALKFVSKTKDCQKYGALIPDGMINDQLSSIYTYKKTISLDYATGKVPPKKARKFKKPAYPKLKIVPASPKEPTQKDTPDKSVSKKIAPAKTDIGKGIKLLSDAALLEDSQLKKTLRKSKRETHKLQASGSSKGVDFESEVPDEQIGKTKDTSEGTDENDDFNNEDDDGGNNDDSGSNDDGDNDAQDSEQTDSDDENPSFTLKDYEEEEKDKEYVFTPEKDKYDDEEKMYEEEDDEVAKELYGDLNITQGLRDTDMTNAEQGREDQQNASHESGFVQEEDDGHLLNLDNISPNVNKITSLMNTSTVPPSPPPVNPFSHLTTTPQQQTQDSTTTTTNPTITLPEIPNFTSLFGFEQRYLASKMKEVVDVAVRLPSNKLKEEAEAENQEFFNQVDSTMKAIIKEQPKSSGKSTQAEEPEFEAADIEMQQDQGNESGHLDDKPDNEAAPKHDWFQTPDKPLTPDRAWNKSKSIDSQLPQKWISTIAKARQPPRTFDELMDTPIDFSA